MAKSRKKKSGATIGFEKGVRSKYRWIVYTFVGVVVLAAAVTAFQRNSDRRVEAYVRTHECTPSKQIRVGGGRISPQAPSLRGELRSGAIRTSTTVYRLWLCDGPRPRIWRKQANGPSPAEMVPVRMP